MLTAIQSTFGRRLQQARRMASLSLRELAEGMDGEVSHTLISRYEKGLAMPNGRIMAKLSSVLGRPADFFFRTHEVTFSELSFRKKARLLVTERKAIEERARDFFSRYAEAEELVGNRIPFALPFCGEVLTDPAQVEGFAERLRSADGWDIGTNPVPNLHQLMELNGIKVHEVETTDRNFDGFSGEANGDPIIVLAKWLDENIPRKRMTAAHELGHIVLPIPTDLPEKEHENLVKPFAGAFLLPRQSFTKSFGGKRSSISLGELLDLKAHYGVSIMALMYRAKQLDLISEALHKRFSMNASQEKWRREGEPRDDLYQGEESHGRLRQLAFQGVAEGEISSSKASSLLDISLQQFRKDYQEAYA